MIKVLSNTKNPLTTIGEVAGVCWGTTDKRRFKKVAEHCFNSGHHRVLEFAEITVLIDKYSARVMREFYTHIVGTSRLQASTRYINYNDFTYYTPGSIERNADAKKIYNDYMKYVGDIYSKLLQEGIPKEDIANILPIGHHTKVVAKINLRALYHLFEVRTCTRAYKEFRVLMDELKTTLKGLDEEWAWLAENLKTVCENRGYCTEQFSCGRVPIQ